MIRALLGLELYDQALDELHYAQKVWGDSSPIEATIGWIFYKRGELRTGINVMKRAYPQYLTAGGEKLPSELLKVLFPIDYWPLITKYSKQNGLDPFLVAALMAQESTFTAEIRSSANAYGLMQLIPATGSRYAKKLGIRNFSKRMLLDPETNIKLGTEYFKDLMARFGGAHYALAGYNAGEARVQQWLDMRPPLPADEFTDDIPFTETQGYVKRILGTAEDYRRLYGGGLLDPNDSLSAQGANAVRASTPATTVASNSAKAPASASGSTAKKPAKAAPTKTKAAPKKKTSSGSSRH